MRRKIIAFDLDGTLAPSKSPLPDRMAELLIRLLDKYQVCVISGGKYELFQKQLVGSLPASTELLKNLHLMPTSGTRYYHFDGQGWKLVYAEDLNDAQKRRIVTALNKGLDESGWRPKRTWGEIIEDRHSQITLSILGQEAPLKDKEAWDPDNSKKMQLRAIIAPLIPEFEVRAAGTTSIDVTKPGIDKAYGMEKLMFYTKSKKEDILYIGDKLVEGGNDYPVKAMGIDCLEIAHWHETTLVIEAIIHAT